MRRGFTVVELLIVIVVIGILATLTIIAYSGVQDNARRAALQSDLSQSAKKLEEYKFKNAETFPANLSAAQTVGIKSSGQNNLSYTAYTTSQGANTGYCMQDSVSGINYYVTAGGSVKEGTCTVATNLAVNPRATSTSGNEWQTRYGMSRTYISNASDGPAAGLNSYARFTQTAADTTGGGRGIDIRGNLDLASPAIDNTWPVTAGETVTISVYVRSSLPNANTRLHIRIHDGVGTWLTAQAWAADTNYTATGTWTRLSFIYTAPVTGYMEFSTRFQAATTWTTGSTIDSTGLSIIKTSTLSEYADGATRNWNWTGAADNSTSTGPIL